MPNTNTTGNVPELVIAPGEGSGLQSMQDKVEQASKALPALGEALAQPAAAFWQKLTQNEALKPSEVTVRLGVNFEGGTRWAIVATAGATIDVEIKWSSKQSGG